jgi:hypothetical protein
MTASTPDELIAGFPHSSLPKVTGEPIFEDLKVIRRLLNTNAMSIASYEGGGRHGHLGIIMTNEEYFALAVDAFPVPNTPIPSAAVVASMTAAVIAETTRLQKEATQVHRTYHNVNKAIKAAAELTHALLYPQPAGPFCKVGDEQTLALKRLADIFEGATRQKSRVVIPLAETVGNIAPPRVQNTVSPPRGCKTQQHNK